jgi:TPP-dependent pyruvate/acetoin dehydrogenase alpha subunit
MRIAQSLYEGVELGGESVGLITDGRLARSAGLAFANAYRDDGKVALVYFGDGAANQGQVYESFNMASLWKLPVVFVCENNQYAMGTSVARASSETHLHKRGASFNIPGEEVDGMDVLAVRDAGKKAIAHARGGKGPVLLEMKTYRYRGHSMSDPAKYRTREEVDSMREQHDPIDAVKKRLIDAGYADEEALKAIHHELKQLVTEGPSDEELERAKKIAVTANKIALESTAAQMAWVAESLLFEGAIITPAESRARLMPVTPEDVQKMAVQIFSPANQAIAEIRSL